MWDSDAGSAKVLLQEKQLKGRGLRLPAASPDGPDIPCRRQLHHRANSQDGTHVRVGFGLLTNNSLFPSNDTCLWVVLGCAASLVSESLQTEHRNIEEQTYWFNKTKLKHCESDQRGQPATLLYQRQREFEHYSPHVPPSARQSTSRPTTTTPGERSRHERRARKLGATARCDTLTDNSSKQHRTVFCASIVELDVDGHVAGRNLIGCDGGVCNPVERRRLIRLQKHWSQHRQTVWT